MNIIHQRLENEMKTNWNLVLSGLGFKSTYIQWYPLIWIYDSHKRTYVYHLDAGKKRFLTQ